MSTESLDLQRAVLVPRDIIPISGDATFSPPLRGIRADGAGVLKVKTLGGGDTVRSLNVAAGEIRYGQFTAFVAAGTTATSLEGLV